MSRLSKRSRELVGRAAAVAVATAADLSDEPDPVAAIPEFQGHDMYFIVLPASAWAGALRPSIMYYV
jgi:hypothetical protein